MSSLFKYVYTSHNNDPYYYRDWHGAKPLEVIADTQKEAKAEAFRILGPNPTGHYWVIRLNSITAIPVCLHGES